MYRKGATPSTLRRLPGLARRTAVTRLLQSLKLTETQGLGAVDAADVGTADDLDRASSVQGPTVSSMDSGGGTPLGLATFGRGRHGC